MHSNQLIEMINDEKFRVLKLRFIFLVSGVEEVNHSLCRE